MKKITLFACFLLSAIIAFGQLSIVGKHILLNKNGVKVIIFDSITNTTKIDYSGTNVKFFKYNTSTATFLLPPDDATGYTIEVNGVITDTIYVIDYHKYKSQPNTCQVISNSGSECEDVTLSLNHTSAELHYFTPNGTNYILPREFSVHYSSKAWSSEKWVDTTLVYDPITSFPAQLTVTAPLCNTEFILTGDQYGVLLGMSDSIKSTTYNAVAVKCYATSIVTIRDPDANNEDEGPTTPKQVKGSAPMEILFMSNANEPVATYYRWEVFKNNQPLITRSDKDHRYTFTESGSYKVKITASNTNCSYSDSIPIDISESQLQIPNVFTPNGDGLNDEFRVAYKSIIEFKAWVFNRWGRKVYYWTDPTKGWNGNIGGKEATPGPYFYIVKAVGSDGKKYTRKGDINLLR